MSGKLYYISFIQVQYKGSSFQFARPFYYKGFKIISYLTDLVIKGKEHGGSVALMPISIA